MFPDLRESVLAKLIDRFGDIETADVYRVALWILAEVRTSAPRVILLDRVDAAVHAQHEPAVLLVDFDVSLMDLLSHRLID